MGKTLSVWGHAKRLDSDTAKCNLCDEILSAKGDWTWCPIFKYIIVVDILFSFSLVYVMIDHIKIKVCVVHIKIIINSKSLDAYHWLLCEIEHMLNG